LCCTRLKTTATPLVRACESVVTVATEATAEADTREDGRPGPALPPLRHNLSVSTASTPGSGRGIQRCNPRMTDRPAPREPPGHQPRRAMLSAATGKTQGSLNIQGNTTNDGLLQSGDGDGRSADEDQPRGGGGRGIEGELDRGIEGEVQSGLYRQGTLTNDMTRPSTAPDHELMLINQTLQYGIRVWGSAGEVRKVRGEEG